MDHDRALRHHELDESFDIKWAFSQQLPSGTYDVGNGLTTGTRRMESPESSHQYGSGGTHPSRLHTRFRQKAKDRASEQLLQGGSGPATSTDWDPVNSTLVEAHQHAVRHREKVSTAWRSADFRRIDRQDVPGLRCAGPLALLGVAGRNTNDCMGFTRGDGGERGPLEATGAPKAAPSGAIRARLRHRGIPHTLPSGLTRSAPGSGAAAKAAVCLASTREPVPTSSRHSPFDPDVGARRDGNSW